MAAFFQSERRRLIVDVVVIGRTLCLWHVGGILIGRPGVRYGVPDQKELRFLPDIFNSTGRSGQYLNPLHKQSEGGCDAQHQDAAHVGAVVSTHCHRCCDGKLVEERR